MNFDRLLAWFRSRQRGVSTAVAFASLCIAALSSTVSVFQAIMLYGQRSTPYQTALYVRQLQMAGDFAGAAHEQWLSIINLHNDCVDRVNGNVPDGDYKTLAVDFRSGSQALHKAYAGTQVTFADTAYDQANTIWSINEDLFDHVVAPSADCTGFLQRWADTGAEAKQRQMHSATQAFVDQLRTQLGVGALSSPQPLVDMRRQAAAAHKDTGTSP
jgi:hypothetical protein